uniref:Uncharacterized protein n=1 Tax=Arundo donax TaxID=35708 RepID=A0A0A9DUC5_ARUDO
MPRITRASPLRVYGCIVQLVAFMPAPRPVTLAPPRRLGVTTNTSDVLPRMRIAPSISHTSDLGSAKSQRTRGSGMNSSSTNLKSLLPSSNSDGNPGLPDVIITMYRSRVGE